MLQLELLKETQSFAINDGPEGCDEVISFLCLASGLHHKDLFVCLFVVVVVVVVVVGVVVVCVFVVCVCCRVC